MPNIDPDLMTQTRKMRRIQISNLPLYMELSEQDIAELVSKFLIKNFLNDPNNNHPIISCTLNSQGNSATLEISSVEETNRLIKVESKTNF